MAGTGSIVINDAATAGITGLTMNGSNSTINLANYNPTAGSFLIGDLAAGVTGTVNVTAGYVKAGDTGGDLFGNSLVVNVAAGATFDFNNNGEDFGGLTGAGNVVLGTAGLSFEEAGNRAFNGSISGTGGVNQAVPYVLTLGGANAYSGTTGIAAGATIRGTAANAFSPNSLVNVTSGGTLDPGGFSQTIAGLTGGAATTNVPVTAGTLTISPAAAATDTFLGNVAGAGNLTVAGPGTEVLGGTGGGVTGTVNVSSGTLRENAVPLSVASAVNVGATGVLDTTASANVASAFNLSGTGTLVKEGLGTLTLAGTNPAANLSAVTLTAGGLTLAASSTGASQVGSPALTVGSGTVAYAGTAGLSTTQAFNGVTLNGSLELNASAGAGGTSAVPVGSLTRLAGSTGTVDFNPVNAGATFTTTTGNGTGGIVGGYATYAAASWAVAGPGGTATPVTPLPQSSYTPNAFATGVHTDVQAATTAAAAASTLDVRFNTAAANTLALAGAATISDGGVLVTPAVGANVSTISNGSSGTGTLTTPANTDLFLHQFNPAAGLTISAALVNTNGTATMTSAPVTTTTSPTVTVGSTAGLIVGEFVAGSNVSAGTRVASINSATSVTLTLAPTAATQTLTFTPPTEVVKDGPGLVQLTGPNATAFNGSVGLNAGVLQVPGLPNLGGYATNASSSAVIFNGGQLATTSTSTVTTAFTQPFLFAAGGGTINVSTGTTLSRNADSIYGSGPLTLTSPGTGILSLGAATSSYTGAVTVNGGILRFSSSQFGTANGVTVNAGGQYQVNDNGVGTFSVATGTPFTIGGAGPAGYADPGAIALTLQSGGSPVSTIPNAVVLNGGATVGVYSTASSSNVASGTYAAALTLSGVVSGTGPLTTAGIAAFNATSGTVNGSGGVLTLTGNNTYAGGTVVASGTLRVNNTAGSGTGAGGVKVNPGGTLGGTGTIAGAVTVAGTITAGANASTGVGTLTTGSQQWNGSGGLLAKVSADGTANDRLVMSGLMVVASPSATFNVSVASAGTPTLAAGNVLVLADDTEAAAANPFAPGANAAATLAALSLTTSGITAPAGETLVLGTQADATSGYDLVLGDAVTAAAPEPTSLLLAGLAAAPLVLGRRRRRRRQGGVHIGA